jgi:hypothetical protein
MLDRHLAPTTVGENVDTLITNVHGKLPDDLATDLDLLKEASQEADDDVPTAWTFAGEALYIKAHGVWAAVALDSALPLTPPRCGPR